jgi:glutamate racemase
MAPPQRPIGVFDSGVGGLTVVRALRARLPHESILYLGDTARVPYGSKSPEVVTKYATRCARFLVEQGARALVIACNTASAVAIPALREAFDGPVIGVIEPGAELAAIRARRHVGVIGTEGTIRSGRYQQLIGAQAPALKISVRACPMFVPLAEEGMAEHAASELIAREYLAPLCDAGIDTLVLGCTHYPVLRPVIERVVGPEVQVIDSAGAVAERAAAALASDSSGDSPISLRLFATDASERFERVGRIFLGEAISSVEWVDV